MPAVQCADKYLSACTNNHCLYALRAVRLRRLRTTHTRATLTLADPQAGKGGGMTSIVARAYNGGTGAEAPAGSSAEPLFKGLEGSTPPEAESVLAIMCRISAEIYSV